MHANESIRGCAVRELKEEACVDVLEEELVAVGILVRLVVLRPPSTSFISSRTSRVREEGVRGFDGLLTFFVFP